MTDFSVPLEVPEKGVEDDQSSLTLPVVAGLSMLSASVLLILILWIALVSDPLGGQPNVSVFIEDKGITIDPGLVGVGGVRPSITPDPDDLAELNNNQQQTALAENSSADNTEQAIQNSAPEIENNFSSVRGMETKRLSVFPLDTLVERTELGLIPKRGSNGDTPFIAYSRAKDFVPDGPKIALVIGGVGLSDRSSEEAIQELPTTTALAFSPYGRNLDKWNQNARKNGFELLLQAPMEPFNFPQNDPGPHTLLVDATELENRPRMNWLMSRLTNYIGVMPSMGGRFTSDETALGKLLTELNSRGLAFIDPSKSVRSVARRVSNDVSTDELGRLPFLKVDIVLDVQPNRIAIEQHLAQLEELARTTGMAVGYADLKPSTIATISSWAKLSEQRGITLVPLSTAISLAQPGI